MIKEFQGQYRFLSNFWPVAIKYEGYLYNSVETAYMAQKSSDPEWKKRCAKIDAKPGAIKRASQAFKLPENWHNEKILIMRQLLSQKFANEPLKSMLLATGDQPLYEGNTWGDREWGVIWHDDIPEGKNILGNLLMEVRASLKEGFTRYKKVTPGQGGHPVFD